MDLTEFVTGFKYLSLHRGKWIERVHDSTSKHNNSISEIRYRLNNNLIKRFEMDEILKRFTFHHKNGNASITLSALDYNDADENMYDLVEDTEAWQCEDEKGDSINGDEEDELNG
jgi:hypothetical protein